MTHHRSEVSDPGRTKTCGITQVRRNTRPKSLVLRGKSYLMAGQADPTAIERKLPTSGKPLQSCRKRRRRQAWFDRNAQTVGGHPREIGIAPMKTFEPCEQVL